MRVNGGSPVGPGFVVYERAPGVHGYDLDMAKASVGRGWHPLLEKLFGFLDRNARVGKEAPYVIQVKEKFGELRVYLMDGDELTSGIVEGLALASATICEDCGASGTPRGRDSGRSWIRTLCMTCHEQGLKR